MLARPKIVVRMLPSRKISTIIPRTGFPALLIACFLHAGCSVVFSDRSAPKSANYYVNPPPSPWKPVPVGQDPGSIEALRADIAYEDPRTGAIISLNSICRKYWSLSLDEMSRNLLLGIKKAKEIKFKYLKIDGGNAKDSTHHGESNDTPVKIRTVVIKKSRCIYDFIYVSEIAGAENSESTFEDFLSSFSAE